MRVSVRCPDLNALESVVDVGILIFITGVILTSFLILTFHSHFCILQLKLKWEKVLVINIMEQAVVVHF